MKFKGMIVLYTVDSRTKGDIIKTMIINLKKKKIKQEFILLYCLDTRKVLKFTRHGMVYNSCGSVKSGGVNCVPSIQRPPNTPVLRRRVSAAPIPMEVLSPSRHINSPVPIPSVSQQIRGPDPSNFNFHFNDQDNISNVSIDDIVDQHNTRLVFYNDDKELNTVYSCFYFKDQLIAVKPEFYEKVKQEFDINQIIYVAELFGVKEITITKVSIKDKGITAGASIDASGMGVTQSLSLERTDYLNENKTLRLTYDLAKSKYIFYTMKEFTSMLSKLSSYDIDDLPISYKDLLRNMDVYRLISSRLEANMSSYDMDLKSVKKHNYGITIDAAYLTKCGFTITKHDVQFSRLKIRLEYYNTEDLILSSNLILNRKCFEMIARHGNLMNSYLENFLLNTSPCEFIKYKVLKQIDPVKHAAILSRVKVFSDLDLTTGSLLEELRGLSPTTMIKCDEEGLHKIQELYPYINNFKRDPRLDDPSHDRCYNMRCSNPLCRCYQLETVQSWIIRVFNMNNSRMLLINSSNSKEFFNTMYRLIINLKHIPNYEKFVKLVTEELSGFVLDNEKANTEEDDDDDFRSVMDFPLRAGNLCYLEI
jgi:hypothetical protein